MVEILAFFLKKKKKTLPSSSLPMFPLLPKHLQQLLLICLRYLPFKALFPGCFQTASTAKERKRSKKRVPVWVGPGCLELTGTLCFSVPTERRTKSVKEKGDCCVPRQPHPNIAHPSSPSSGYVVVLIKTGRIGLNKMPMSVPRRSPWK